MMCLAGVRFVAMKGELSPFSPGSQAESVPVIRNSLDLVNSD